MRITFLFLLFILFTSSINYAQTFDRYYKTEKEWIIPDPEISGSVVLSITEDQKFVFLDLQSARISVFDPDMNLISKFGRSGRGPGEFVKATDVIVDEENNIYVTDISLKRLTKFDIDGNVIATFSLEGLPVDMSLIDTLVCIHTGGVSPMRRDIVDCYDRETGSHNFNILPVSDILKGKMVSFSNFTFQTIQSTNDRLVALNHLADGIINLITAEGEIEFSFTVENEFFRQPELPGNYTPMSHKLSDYIDALVHSIFVVEDTIIVQLMEFGTGDKFLDMYNVKGERLIESVIDTQRRFIIYADRKGALYSISHADDEENLKLNKYVSIKPLKN